jgi:hypothetical protein
MGPLGRKGVGAYRRRGEAQIWWGKAPERSTGNREACSVNRPDGCYYATKRAEPWSIMGHGSARL